MPAYIVATVQIKDFEKFGQYGKATSGIAQKYGGETLILGKIDEILEGDVDSEERVVVSKFPSADDARSYVNSSEYQAGKKLRIGAGSVQMRLIDVPA